MNNARQDLFKIRPRLTFGFNLMAEANDWNQYLRLCQAVQTEINGHKRTVTVPSEKTVLFIQLLKRMISVTDIHGVTVQGRVELPDYLKANGIS